jgi:hypothetical protein
MCILWSDLSGGQTSLACREGKSARHSHCAFFARQVAERRLDEDEAFDAARELACGLVEKACKL